MSKYTPHTEQEIAQMCAKVGVNSLDELYADIPNEIVNPTINIGEGASQFEVYAHIKSLADKNKCYSAVLRGAGIYDHLIPPVVTSLASREEFVTAYTPYQPEISQGILQSIFEYQTQMCMLTGMDVSNASVYDGAVAMAEAIVMCCERKNRAIITGKVNPQYIQVAKTYCYAHEIELIIVQDKDGLVDIDKTTHMIDDQVACVVAQCPNYVGLIEDMASIGQMTSSKGVKFVYVFNPISASILPTPAEVNADVAVGEGQCLGLPMCYGGATLGIMTSTKAMSRRLPGRIVGQTTDNRGNRCFVLTLQAREQHIRREKALSSICSNQAHNALRASIYLNCVGKVGLVQIAQQCIDKSHYLAQQLCKSGGKLKYKGEFFDEFMLEGGINTVERLKEQDILGGLPVDNDTLWCVTEKPTKSVLDCVVEQYKEAK
ncbi:MAG: aminomethyl-transferring glycine dehydrogenase subunit GcvPA [Clostridia bacterium]|nr:aminomethyl-transferring glycine dehydrogenase subunit GcvPA [Clostridia bacterium]